MFCPKCKAEYETIIFVCDDCKVDLVEDLNLELQNRDVEFECIADLLDIGQISLLKSVLDEENIVYFIQGENSLYMQPGVVTARLLVNKDQLVRAQEILKDLL